MAKARGTLLIDGSNVVHALFQPFGGRGEIGDCEADLVRHLSAWASGQPGTELEIVFDGGWRPIQGKGSEVRVHFSEGLSADELLLERVRALRYAGRRASVVTMDRALADAVRAEEGRVIHPDRLREWLSA